MKEFKYVVTDNEGIHARPAGELVKLVKGFESTVSIEKDGKKVDCRKLLALMGVNSNTFETGDDAVISCFCYNKNTKVIGGKLCLQNKDMKLF